MRACNYLKREYFPVFCYPKKKKNQWATLVGISFNFLKFSLGTQSSCAFTILNSSSTDYLRIPMSKRIFANTGLTTNVAIYMTLLPYSI